MIEQKESETIRSMPYQWMPTIFIAGDPPTPVPLTRRWNGRMKKKKSRSEAHLWDDYAHGHGLKPREDALKALKLDVPLHYQRNGLDAELRNRGWHGVSETDQDLL